ncbi:MAG: FmdB family zinc ribbon protein [Thermodesulfobacteriota bacterium]
MPIYEYGCENCGKIDEVLQGISEDNPEVCRFCGKGPVKRLISKSSFHLKGSGWYVTDYGGKNNAVTSENSSASEPKSEAKSEPKTDAKKESSGSEE